MAAKKKKTTKKAKPATKPAKKATAKPAKKAAAKPEQEAAMASPALQELLAYALSLPEAWEDHPWGESVAKIRKKVFVFFGVERPKHGVFLCVKLPESASEVMPEPFAEPAGYGLGKADWVYIRHDRKPSKAMLRQMKEWIAESYRAVAPKKLAKLISSADEA